MVSQFVSTHQVRLLGDLPFDFPPGTHAIGRLDNLSEGLLILTTNKKVTKLLFQGPQPHTRTYHVQVRGMVEAKTVQQLSEGISIRIRGGEQWMTTPCSVSIIEEPVHLLEPSELETGYPPYTWLSITLTEGKFHQVRKMVAAVRHKCRRLIRVSIEDLGLEDLQPGEIREIDEEEFFRLLKIEDWR
jgi:23S rRNA pseudouridine2457 synthase